MVVAQKEMFPKAAGHILMLAVTLTVKMMEEDRDEEILGLTREVLNDSVAHLMWHDLTLVAITHPVSSSAQ